MIDIYKYYDPSFQQKYAQRIPKQQQHDGSFSVDWICISEPCQQFTQLWLQEETGR